MPFDRQKWWWPSVGLVVLLAGVLGFVLLTGGEESPPAPECRLLAPPSTSPGFDSGGLRIVERGHSVADGYVTTGVIIENTTDKVAYRTRVSFDVLSADQSSLVYDEHRDWQVQEVPFIPPRARVAVGVVLGLRLASFRNPLPPIAKISVEPRVSYWLEPGDGGSGSDPFKATVIVDESEHSESGAGYIGYTTESTNCAPLVSRGTSFVFRDSSGKIVGGAVNPNEASRACAAGGTSDRVLVSVGLGGMPESVDLARTEVTPYCDVAEPARPRQSGDPVN